jgi:hypothetical protein
MICMLGIRMTHRYLRSAHKLLWKQKAVYVVYLLFYTVIHWLGFLANNTADPYALFPFSAAVLAYLFIVYVLLLPHVFQKYQTNEPLTIAAAVSQLPQSGKKAVIVSLWLSVALFACLWLVYLLLDLPFQTNIFGQLFPSETANTVTFGFYPLKAALAFAGTFLFIPSFAIALFYALQNISIVAAIRKGMQFSFAKATFAMPFVFLYAVTQLVYHLFVPIGNYGIFVRNLITTYCDLIIFASLFFAYTEHATRAAQSVKSAATDKKQHLIAQSK